MTSTDPHPMLPDIACPECHESGVLWVEYRPDPRPIGVWPWYVCQGCGHEEIGGVLPWCDACNTWHRDGECL